MMRSFVEYSGWRRTCTSGIFAVLLIGCQDPDPRTVRGALAAASRAAQAADARQLFRLIDRRARAAMGSIVADRRQSAQSIAADYPEAERAAALAALGGAERARDAADLFAQRCAAECLTELAEQLGAPERETPRGDGELEVTTVEGRVLRMYRGKDGWWGLVWHTQALSEERTRAARERLQIEANAGVYRRRRALEQVGPR